MPLTINSQRCGRFACEIIFTPTPRDLKPVVASGGVGLYCLPVAANSATWVCKPGKHKEHKLHQTARSFFSPAFYGGAVWEDFCPVGFLLPRSCTPAQRYRLSCASEAGSSSAKGASPMQFSSTQNPPATSGKAAAHRAMAIAALHADSSLSVRLARYNTHMDKARSLDAKDACSLGTSSSYMKISPLSQRRAASQKA